jgi:hypothetical protein
MDTFNRASLHGFLDEAFRASFRFDDLGQFCLFVELKNLRTDFLTRAAAGALIFINIYTLAHFLFPFLDSKSPFIIANGIWFTLT